MSRLTKLKMVEKRSFQQRFIANGKISQIKNECMKNFQNSY